LLLKSKPRFIIFPGVRRANPIPNFRTSNESQTITKLYQKKQQILKFKKLV